MHEVHQLGALLAVTLFVSLGQLETATAVSHWAPTQSQEDFLNCKRQRMEGWLQTAGLVLKTIAVESGLLDPAGELPLLLYGGRYWALGMLLGGGV